MILTIAGADFSGANIGQNNSVTITLNKTGANGSKSSVTLKKDESVSTETVIATGLSVASGYENLVVTVTMTGTGDVSGWYSNGVVTIPSDTLITGNITIKATASKIATGGGEVVEPDQPGTGGGSVTPPVTPEKPGTGGGSGTQLISTFRNNPANAQYVYDGTYKVVDGVVSFAGSGETYKYFILPLDVFNITDLKCITGIKDNNDIAPIVFLKNNEMKAENIVGDLTFGNTQKIDGVTIHSAFMYYNGGFPSIPEGANYVAFSDFIDRETIIVSDEKLTITFR